MIALSSSQGFAMMQVQEGDLFVCTASAEFDHQLMVEVVSFS